MDAIQRINDDFKNRRQPFTTEKFPEEQLLEEVDPDDDHMAHNLVTAFCTLDYNRDATRLKDNLVELWERDLTHFAPGSHDPEALATDMEDIGFRYYNRDASGLSHNYDLIASEYGTVESMVKATNCHAPTFVDQLQDDGFKYLKGDKLAPFYTRVASNHVKEMAGLWQLDIPVDTHIRRLSQELFGQMEDWEIRAEWRRVGRQESVSPHVIDGALWLIGNRWDDWGEDYWETVTG